MSYDSTTDHILAELDRIDTLLDGYSERSEQTFEHLDLDAKPGGGDPTTFEPAIPANARTEAASAAEQIASTVEQVHTEGVELRVAHLADTFDLTRRHLDVLMLALAPDVDPAYHEQFRDLQTDDALDRPTISLIGSLFGGTDARTVTATELVAADSPLRDADLVRVDTVPDTDSSRLYRTVVVTDRIHDYLLDHDALDPALSDVASLESTDETLDSLRLDEDVRASANRLAAEAGRYYCHGPEGAGKSRVVAALAADRLLRASLPAVLEAGVLPRLRREAALLDCPLHLTDADAVLDSADTGLEAVFDAVADLDCGVFVTGEASWTPTGTMATELDAIVEFPYPSMDLRERFWQDHDSDLPEAVDPEVLAGTFRLTQGELDAALATAHSLAEGEITAEDVYAGCSAQSAGELEDLAQKIEPASSWEDIQLREQTERKLRIVRDHVKHQARIYGEWGFAEQFSRGTGVVALFSGPSGTGKTMAAEILAGEVGMDLYKIDLSSVVSKYIGETEENLEEIFEAAENSNAILLFDEADAVFGDRAEVSSATDRYANVEVNYLLQRIEAYDGVVLLTSNYESNIDSAFTRRIDHTVSFKRPEEATREAIWRGIFPADAPLGEIDYDFLSSRDVTGGQIKTIGQTAAILAADEECIEMAHVVQAIQLEAQKTGRLLDPTEFGTYRQYLYGFEKPAPDPRAEEDDRESDPERTPEEVVRLFFDRLQRGEYDGVHDLYHSNAVAETFSYREVQAISQSELGAVKEFERVREDPSRVVLEFSQRLQEGQKELEYELRDEDGNWRVFDRRRVREEDVVVE